MHGGEGEVFTGSDGAEFVDGFDEVAFADAEDLVLHTDEVGVLAAKVAVFGFGPGVEFEYEVEDGFDGGGGGFVVAGEELHEAELHDVADAADDEAVGLEEFALFVTGDAGAFLGDAGGADAVGGEEEFVFVAAGGDNAHRLRNQRVNGGLLRG